MDERAAKLVSTWLDGLSPEGRRTLYTLLDEITVTRERARDVAHDGGPADLVLFSARRWSEFLSRPQADRIVMRNGMGIDRSLPDYRELDPILGA